jgi:hypothetical protein
VTGGTLQGIVFIAIAMFSAYWVVRAEREPLSQAAATLVGADLGWDAGIVSFEDAMELMRRRSP